MLCPRFRNTLPADSPLLGTVKCRHVACCACRGHAAHAAHALQVYVALSRARSMEGLRILNLQPSRIKTCPEARRFYARSADRQRGGLGATAVHGRVLLA